MISKKRNRRRMVRESRAAPVSRNSTPLVSSELLRQLLLLALMAVLSVSLVWLTGQGLKRIPVGKLQLYGDFHKLSEAEVRGILQSHMRDGYFRTDVRAIRNSLRELKWVYRARVQRLWPPGAGIIVWVQEHNPQAVWNRDSYLDPGGVAHALPYPADGLPHLSGPADAGERVLAEYRNLQALLHRDTEFQLLRLTEDPACCWRLELSCGETLITSLHGADIQLRRFLGLYGQLREQTQRPLLRADLRYPNGVAVLWGEDGTQQYCVPDSVDNVENS